MALDERSFDEAYRGPQMAETDYTVIIRDNANRLGEFQEAIATEINGLRAKGVFEEIKRSSLTTSELSKMLIIKAKLILTIKDPGEPEERKKARIVAQAVGSKG